MRGSERGKPKKKEGEKKKTKKGRGEVPSGRVLNLNWKLETECQRFNMASKTTEPLHV